MSMKCINVIIRAILLGGSFRQKVHTLVKMDSGNQPANVLLIQTKYQKLLERVERIFIK